MNIRQFFRNKENIKKIKILAGVLIILALLSKDSPIMSQSVFGIFSGFLTFGVILILVGVVLIIIPEPATTVIGIIMTIVGFLIAGGTVWAFFESLPEPLGIPIWAIIMILIAAGYLFRRRLARQYTY